MKKIIISTFLFIILALLPVHAQVQDIYAENINYDTTYKNLPLLDFEYEENEDPDQIYDYQPYISTPYALIRISSPITCKNALIKPGYYQLSVKIKDGYEFVMFKQNGKIKHIVPIYAKQYVVPALTYKEPPKPKKNPLFAPFRALRFVFVKMFGRYKKPPEIPKYLLDEAYIDNGRYYILWLYKNEYIYKMIFIPTSERNKK